MIKEVNRKMKKYDVGLNIDSTSVGWAVTDDKGELLKFKKKNMWGVRLFEEAKHAAERRSSRSMRRRYNKRRERIRWLDEFFLDDVKAVDPIFRERMEKLSFLDREDKSSYLGSDTRYNLFVGEFNDKDYFRKYPTVYHLRKELMECREKMDPRLIYLALHHIIKYRGNFLYEGQSISAKSLDATKTFLELFDTVENVLGIEVSPSHDDMEKMIEILTQKCSKSHKVAKVLELPSISGNKRMKALFNGIVGLKCNLDILYDDEIIIDGAKAVIDFSSESFALVSDGLKEHLDERYIVIELMEKIYNWTVLKDVLGDSSCISDAMIHRYEQHETDLELVKRLMKRDFPSGFAKIFKSSNGVCYENYINHPRHMDKDKYTAQDVLCQEIEKILKSKEMDSQEYRICFDGAQKCTLFPKIRTVENGAIPYQLHLEEMKAILDNQAIYYPSLKKNYDRLCMLVSFRYPYYIGPLSKTSQFAWLIRKEGHENERIAPWNLEDTVDIDATAEEFIQRLIGKCTYLVDEPVLPKNSLFISRFNVLNEVNKITINGEPLEVLTKNKLIDDLFMKKKIVKEKDLINWLLNEQVIYSNEAIIKGYQKENEFASSLAPWIDMKRILGDMSKDNVELFERIVLWCTTFEDKAILERKIRRETACSDEQIREILKLRYKGWSKLSRRLLVETRSRGMSILDVMEQTTMNFNQVLFSKKYTFREQVEASLSISKKTISMEDIQKLSGSPALKRGIWQTVKIIQEIEKVMKCPPQNIHIKFSRNDKSGGRTVSRENQIRKIYECFKKKECPFPADKDVLKFSQLKRIEDEKVYLYYLQQGRCMYSGELIDADNLSSYHIDYIVPRTVIYDNSIDNKVLVKSVENIRKSDSLVIDRKVIERQRKWWEFLLENRFMSSKKFRNLTRLEYNRNDINWFVNRQLVETRQIVKHIANLVNEAYPTTHIVTVRSDMVSNFRIKYNLPRTTELNDLWKAHEALIISNIGMFMMVRFPGLQEEYMYGEYKAYRKGNSRGKYGFILGLMEKEFADKDTGEVIWSPAKRVSYIEKAFDYKDYFVTKKLEPQSGQMFNLTVLPGDRRSNGKTAAKIPVNKNRGNVNKYGGFSGANIAYSLPVKYKDKKKWKAKVIGVPIYLQNASEDRLNSYLKETLKSEMVFIVGKPLYKNTLLVIDGQRYYMSSDKELVNARQFNVPYQMAKEISFLMDEKSGNKETDLDSIFDGLCNAIEMRYPGYARNIADIRSNRNKYIMLSSDDKIKVIKEILKISKAKPECPNLKIIGLSSTVGRKSGKNIDLCQADIYMESITGMYTKLIKYDV